MGAIDMDFGIGGHMASILQGQRRASSSIWQLTGYKPKGLWTLSRVRTPCRVHMTSRALIAWRRTGRAQVAALTRCGYVLHDAITYVEEPSDDYCDACLLADDEFVVYQHLDGSGNVLYIGYTSNLVARTDAHRAQSPWWPMVRDISAQRFDDELTARRAEIAAIAAERPPHNTMGVAV